MFVNILCYCSTEKAAHSIPIDFKYPLKIVLDSAIDSNSNVTIFVTLNNHFYYLLCKGLYIMKNNKKAIVVSVMGRLVK